MDANPRRTPRLNPFIERLNGTVKPLFYRNHPVIEVDDTGSAAKTPNDEFLLREHDLVERAIKPAVGETVAQYNDKVHEELNGESPIARAMRLMKENPFAQPASPSKRDLPFLLSLGQRDEVTITKSGVTANNLTYKPIEPSLFKTLLTRNGDDDKKFPIFGSEDNLVRIALQDKKTGQLLALELDESAPARPMTLVEWKEHTRPHREAMRNTSIIERYRQRERDRIDQTQRATVAAVARPSPGPPTPNTRAPQRAPEAPPSGWRRPAVVDPKSWQQ